MGGVFKNGAAILIALAMVCQAGLAKPSSIKAADKEQKAREKLAKKLVSLINSSNLQVLQLSKSSGGDQTNKFDGNPFKSTTTYHDLKVDWCKDMGPNSYCDKWIPAFVSRCGFHEGDKSPLEGAVADAWTELSKTSWEDQEADAKAKGQAQRQYAIWNVTMKDPDAQMIDADTFRSPKFGSLKRQNIAEMDLNDDLKQKADQIGVETAEDAMNFTFEENDGKEMPNIEGLRAMGASFARQFRNRLVTNLGGMRTGQPGIEFELGEFAPNCDAYKQRFLAEKKQQGGQINYWLALYKQNQDDGTIDERYEKCKQMLEAGVYDEVENVVGMAMTAQDINSRFDVKATMENIKLLDYAGQIPEDAQFSAEKYTTDVYDYAVGGKSFQIKRVTNAQQINSYNSALKDAAAGWKAAASRSPNINPKIAKKILAQQIPIGSMTVEHINSFTPEMVDELKKTSLTKTDTYKQSKAVSTEKVTPETFLEETPSELIVTASGGGG